MAELGLAPQELFLKSLTAAGLPRGTGKGRHSCSGAYLAGRGGWSSGFSLSPCHHPTTPAQGSNLAYQCHLCLELFSLAMGTTIHVSSLLPPWPGGCDASGPDS